MNSRQKPNIVYVITDDQGYGDLGCLGNTVLHTPNIDRFHAESIRLSDYHVGPTCAPTRAGLMTGHYANSTGVWHTVGGRSLLRKDEWTLASALRENGYRTGIFGKWHLGDNYPYRPIDRGFEAAVVHGGGGISQTPDYWGNDYFDDTYNVNGENKAFSGYCTDVFFREALSYIEANKNQPFFCYIAPNAPHEPYNVDRKYYEMYKDKAPDARARFYGMITNIDENFGLLRGKLREWGLEDNTILIFMTDNGTSCGASLNEEGFVQSGYNAGMRGVKFSPYDGGHRVPLFLRWPDGNLDQGRDVTELTANIDIMPTLLELCGIPVRAGHHFHGKSIVPLLCGDGDNWEERTIVTDSQRVAYPIKWRQSCVMTKRWRLINGQELYDIIADGEQRNNIADDEPDVVRQLRSGYEQWWSIVSTQFDEDIPISIGADSSEVCLTLMDWRNEACIAPSSQARVRGGEEVNGYWEIHVEQSGGYEIELRRWPKESGHPLSAGIDGDDIEWRKDCIPQVSWPIYTGGKALPIKQAVLKIGNNEYAQEAGEGDREVTFIVRLQEGPAHLQTWLNGLDQFTIGAYYVYVRLLEEVS